jgi:hypothetical protein
MLRSPGKDQFDPESIQKEESNLPHSLCESNRGPGENDYEIFVALGLAHTLGQPANDFLNNELELFIPHREHHYISLRLSYPSQYRDSSRLYPEESPTKVFAVFPLPTRFRIPSLALFQQKCLSLRQDKPSRPDSSLDGALQCLPFFRKQAL